MRDSPAPPMTPAQSPLGKASSYIDQYDPALLFPLPRATKRQELGLGEQLPFFGADAWTAFELSWLNLRGKPQLALAHITVPCETPNIIESKSFKLYLNSAGQDRQLHRPVRSRAAVPFAARDQAPGIGLGRALAIFRR